MCSIKIQKSKTTNPQVQQIHMENKEIIPM